MSWRTWDTWRCCENDKRRCRPMRWSTRKRRRVGVRETFEILEITGCIHFPILSLNFFTKNADIDSDKQEVWFSIGIDFLWRTRKAQIIAKSLARSRRDRGTWLRIFSKFAKIYLDIYWHYCTKNKINQINIKWKHISWLSFSWNENAPNMSEKLFNPVHFTIRYWPASHFRPTGSHWLNFLHKTD